MPAELRPTHLSCEYPEDPPGLTVARRRLVWVVESEERDQFESAYRILVTDACGALDGVTIPANTATTLEISTRHPYTVSEGSALAADAEPVRFVSYKNGVAVFDPTSGSFCFAADE